MTIAYRFVEKNDKKILTKHIKQFYTEDTYAKNITDEKISSTFTELEQHPEKGCFLLVEDNNEIIGYALLINYWSNEYGGNLLHIDEIYITPSYRGKGIGTQFLNYIITKQFNQPVAIPLEVTKHNKKVIKFYQKFGFKKSPYTRLIYEYK